MFTGWKFILRGFFRLSGKDLNDVWTTAAQRTAHRFLRHLLVAFSCSACPAHAVEVGHGTLGKCDSCFGRRAVFDRSLTSSSTSWWWISVSAAGMFAFRPSHVTPDRSRSGLWISSQVRVRPFQMLAVLELSCMACRRRERLAHLQKAQSS